MERYDLAVIGAGSAGLVAALTANRAGKRVAMLEKNIALALYNRGQYVEAVEYFDKTLAYYGEKLPKHLISVLLKVFVGFLDLLIALYLPFLKWKGIPTQKDNEITKLFSKKSAALAIIDPKRMFIESFCRRNKLQNFDLTRVENGVGVFATYSALFSWTGISFRLSGKVLEFAKDKINKNDLKSALYYEQVALVHNLVTGNWGIIQEYDAYLVNQNLSAGETFYSRIYNGAWAHK